MKRPIPRPVHGFLDYAYGLLFAASPHLFGFDDNWAARLTAYAFGIAVIAASLLTRYEWGLVRVLPFRVHLLLDFVGGLLAIAAPWALGFGWEWSASLTFAAFGLVSLVVSLLTQPAEQLGGRVVAAH